jgi:hypothetical protein
MKMIKLLSLIAAVCSLIAPAALCQSSGSREDEKVPAVDGNRTLDEVPQYDLQFSKGVQIQGVDGSPVIVMPIQCSPGGTAFVQAFRPPNFRDAWVASLEENGGHMFSLKSVPEIYDVTLLSFFPNSSELGFLVYATRDRKDSQYSMMSPTGPVAGTAKLGVHQGFIVIFDYNGNYKSTIELPANLEYRKMAMLDSGEFALLAYDPSERVALLQVLDSTGQFERTVQLPSGMMDDPEVRAGETGNGSEAVVASASLSHWQFAAAGRRVVLYRPHAKGDLLELGSGGAVRYVPLAAPDGYELDGFVASADRWIVRYRRSGISDAREIDARPDAGNYLLLQVNRLDGNPETRLVMKSGSPFNLACEADGKLTSFSLDDNSRFVVSVAAIPK